MQLAFYCRYRPKGDRHRYVSGALGWRSNPLRYLTSLKKERETQAACVLAVRVGNHLDERNNGRLRLIQKPSFDGDIECTWFLVNVRNAINSGRQQCRSGELFQT
jgi:hypothetical protein